MVARKPSLVLEGAASLFYGDSRAYVERGLPASGGTTI